MKSSIAGSYLPLLDMKGLKPEGEAPYAIEINAVPDLNDDGATDLADVEYLLRNDANSARTLSGDDRYGAGDFRSRECVEFLKQADIVITNPPFSLFREYVGQLIDFKKKFLIIGSKNSITYKEIFKLIREGKIWLGHGFASGNAYFAIPQEFERTFASGVYDSQTGLIKFRNVGWFTNMDYESRHDLIPIYKKYTTDEYPNYDNYNAIEVSKTADIPAEYDRAMGVPITFLDRHNPDQFEILGITDRDNNSGLKTKDYTESDAPNFGDLNRRAAIKVGDRLKSTYARLLITRRQ